MGKISSITSKYMAAKELLIWKSLLTGLVLLLVYQLINGRDLVSLLLLIGGAWIIVLCYYCPMPAIFIIMLLSTNVLMFIDTTYFPHWQVFSGLRITILDGLMVIMLFISLYKLQKRGEYPIFLKQILLVAGAVMLPFIAFLLVGETNLDIGMNRFRIMFIYAFYFILAGNIDSPKRLKILIGMIFLILFVSVALQIMELIMGRRILLGNIAPGSIYSNSIVSVGDEIVPYLWNRAIIYLSLGLFLGLGGYFSGKNRFIFLTVTLLGGFGIIATLNRAWFIAMIFGIFVFILMQKKLELRDLRRFFIMIIGLACLVLLIGILSKASYGSFISTWFERIKTIQHY
ncbi:hypothetical protein FJZ33_06255, partial [Candidatus Poribacteria bacterium]|nr:hypothetical protein [Candidatus Poribacteria bacterium]